MQLESLAKQLTHKFPDTLICNIANGELTIEVMPDDLLLLATILRANPYCFEQLIDLCGIDYLHYPAADYPKPHHHHEQHAEPQLPTSRFAVVYHLLSITHNLRVRLRCFCKEKNQTTNPPVTQSVMEIWPVADWYEREAFDMFGIEFIGHPNLQRILMDYEFRDHPLRKDFPLAGRHEVYYAADTQQVEYRPTNVEEHSIIKKIMPENIQHTQLVTEKHCHDDSQ